MPADAPGLTGTPDRSRPRGGKTDRILHLTLISTFDDVRRTLEGLAPVLAGWDILEDDRFRIEILLAEVLNNVVEHACASLPQSPVDLEIARTDDGLAFAVVDLGVPMPGRRLPEAHRAPVDAATQDLPEGGFGWALIRDLSRDLSYKRLEGRNRLAFTYICGRNGP